MLAHPFAAATYLPPLLSTYSLWSQFMGMASGEMAGRAATCPCFYAPRPWGACGLVSFCSILEARVRILIAAHYLVPIRQ